MYILAYGEGAKTIKWGSYVKGINKRKPGGIRIFAGQKKAASCCQMQKK